MKGELSLEVKGWRVSIGEGTSKEKQTNGQGAAGRLRKKMEGELETGKGQVNACRRTPGL